MSRIVNCLIRQRPGHFIYADGEFDIDGYAIVPLEDFTCLEAENAELRQQVKDLKGAVADGIIARLDHAQVWQPALED